jgi:hypothetical protein
MGSTGILAYVDGVVDNGIFDATMNNSPVGFNTLRLGGVPSTTPIYWEYIKISGTTKKLNLYTYDGISTFTLVASTGNVQKLNDKPISPVAPSTITGIVTSDNTIPSSNVPVALANTITFPTGQSDTAVSPSIVNAGSTLTAGSYGDTYIGLDETKMWSRKLADHELREQYLFDRIYTNLPYVEGIGFGKAQTDALYLDMSSAEKQAGSATLRGALYWLGDATTNILPTNPVVYIKATNNTSTGKTLFYSVLSSTGTGSTSSGCLAGRFYNENTNAGNTSLVTALQVTATNAGSGGATAIACTQGNLTFATTNDGVFWQSKAKIYFDGTNIVIDPAVSGAGGVNFPRLTASQAVMTDASSNLITADYLNQAVKTTSSPTFAGANLSGLTASKPVYTDGSKNLVSGNSVYLPLGAGQFTQSTTSVRYFMLSGSQPVQATIGNAQWPTDIVGTLVKYRLVVIVNASLTNTIFSIQDNGSDIANTSYTLGAGVTGIIDVSVNTSVSSPLICGKIDSSAGAGTITFSIFTEFKL